jgi:hypothetical protein
MGSHGGATAEGQRSILAHYGITEAAMGCPVKSSMEVVEIGRKMNGLTPPERARVARIKNTLLLTEMDASESMLAEVQAHERLTQMSDPAPFGFDATGNLLPC